ncbi:alpha/beta fold hydrolase [Coleofasciculus sp. H7-2]|uniref:alpha/beta fold hydrolase n=1 Tax=Coleofasciculus sp. H7-2 TaxID=3351545 RepID=UPI00366CDA9E
MTTNLDNYFTPTNEQIAQTKQAIEAYFLKWYFHPDKREGAGPYYQIHEPGEPIRGTVMIFHGFAAKPTQMWVLADYLYRNGFNIYQVPLTGHCFVPADNYWAQIDLKPEFRDPIREQMARDPVIHSFLSNIVAKDSPSQLQRPTVRQMGSLIARIGLRFPRLVDMTLAIERRNDREFQRYFTSSHMEYLNDAKQRLAELEAMPGPIYTVGLSVGGAVALALAAAQPNRVKKVVSYAPLLEVGDEMRERYINLAGPLDVREFSWEQGVSFPVGCLTAANYFGGFVRSQQNLQNLKNIPTFFVLTENDDATDNKVIQQFFNSMGGDAKGHRCYLYPESDLVPHPMVNPFDVSQGMVNRFWKSLYQETFRFLASGAIDCGNMSNIEEAADVPSVPNYF